MAALACSSGGTWRRVETPHFVLHTDLGSKEARRAGVALESTRDALVSAAWPTVRFGQRKAEAYVLANGLDFERYFGRRTDGLFMRGTPPRFFLYGRANRWELRRTTHVPTPSVLRHEMAHQLSAEVWPHQPLWFAEGLANFLEPIFYSRDEASVMIGAINHSALRSYRSVRTTRLRDALAWNRGIAHMPEREAAGLHGISWLFVHWLYHEHREELGVFLGELGRGTPGDRALRIAVPDFDDDAIDRELFEYQKRPRFEARVQPIVRPLRETPITEASLEETLLGPNEVDEIVDVLAATAKLHTGRSLRQDRADPPRRPRPVARPISHRAAVPESSEPARRCRGE